MGEGVLPPLTNGIPLSWLSAQGFFFHWCTLFIISCLLSYHPWLKLSSNWSDGAATSLASPLWEGLGIATSKLLLQPPTSATGPASVIHGQVWPVSLHDTVVWYIFSFLVRLKSYKILHCICCIGWPCLDRALSYLLRRFDYADFYTVVLCVQDKGILQWKYSYYEDILW